MAEPTMTFSVLDVAALGGGALAIFQGVRWVLTNWRVDQRSQSVDRASEKLTQNAFKRAEEAEKLAMDERKRADEITEKYIESVRIAERLTATVDEQSRRIAHMEQHIEAQGEQIEAQSEHIDYLAALIEHLISLIPAGEAKACVPLPPKPVFKAENERQTQP